MPLELVNLSLIRKASKYIHKGTKHKLSKARKAVKNLVLGNNLLLTITINNTDIVKINDKNGYVVSARRTHTELSSGKYS